MGFIVLSPKTNPFTRDIPVESREQITEDLLSILCLPCRVVQNLPLSPWLFSFAICECACVYAYLLLQRNKNSERMAGVFILKRMLP